MERVEDSEYLANEIYEDETFIEFLRYSIGDAQNPPVSAKDIDWMKMMEFVGYAQQDTGLSKKFGK